jgi:hypothetical protein
VFSVFSVFSVCVCVCVCVCVRIRDEKRYERYSMFSFAIQQFVASTKLKLRFIQKESTKQKQIVVCDRERERGND